MEEDAIDRTSWWSRTQWTGRPGGGGRMGAIATFLLKKESHIFILCGSQKM